MNTDRAATAILDQLRPFERQQAERCRAIGIDVQTMAVSHVAVRCRTWLEYVATRDQLEEVSVANLENVWNGRPISKLVLAEPVPTEDGRHVTVIELIPPFHQRVYRMGLEHVGYVLPEPFDEFVDRHIGVLTGQQFQSPVCAPVYRWFSDYTHVKFYERSLRTACELEGATFDGFTRAHWMPEDPSAGPYEVE